MTSEGQALKDQGMERALSPETIEEWKEQFRSATVTLAKSGNGFTSEDVLDRVGLPSGTIKSNANNAVGAMMNGLARRGVICKTTERRPSRRPSSHAAELVVWKGNDVEVTHNEENTSPVCPGCGSADGMRRIYVIASVDHYSCLNCRTKHQVDRRQP